MLKNYEEKVIKLEQEKEGLEIEFCNLKGSIFQQGNEITSLTDEVRMQVEHTKELLKDNEAWKGKSREFEEINKKIDSYGEQLQRSLRTNMELGKEMQRETSLATKIKEANKKLEKYKEEIKETYAQIVKEKETIKEVCLEVKTRNDQQETEIRQAIRKERVTNSKLVQNTADRMMGTSDHLMFPIFYGNIRLFGKASDEVMRDDEGTEARSPNSNVSTAHPKSQAKKKTENLEVYTNPTSSITGIVSPPS
ncbi:uncharacterized protein PF3D7_1120000-like [Procambarus clarkii]|uniref:uncharacterized protein PF3D7_1120000-like n=1 Tax=Procambarus clarkii TaxID=6728 RepID=UPI0037425C76